ncbi:MAG: AbrB/MazE/SpoVT family DNA-binding domain-containing protein [Acidobacteriota bacterium]
METLTTETLTTETLTTKTLVVDAEGRIVIPSGITLKRGLHPGDQIAILETDEGLLVRPEHAEAKAWLDNWWNGMTDEEKIEARKEAEEYEALSEEERDAIWDQFPVSIEEEDEGDEIDITAISNPAQSSA